jgi:hypothetical protein
MDKRVKKQLQYHMLLSLKELLKIARSGRYSDRIKNTHPPSVVSPPEILIQKHQKWTLISDI